MNDCSILTMNDCSILTMNDCSILTMNDCSILTMNDGWSLYIIIIIGISTLQCLHTLPAVSLY